VAHFNQLHQLSHIAPPAGGATIRGQRVSPRERHASPGRLLSRADSSPWIVSTDRAPVCGNWSGWVVGKKTTWGRWRGPCPGRGGHAETGQANRRQCRARTPL